MIPLIAAKELSSDQRLWGMGFHYSMALCPILVMATADGLARWRKKHFFKFLSTFPLESGSVLILIINLALIPVFSPWKYITHAEFWRWNSIEKTSSAALSLIPPSATVCAQSSIAPHLTHRDLIYCFDKFKDLNAINPDYFVACRGLNTWPVSFSDIETILKEKEKSGYHVIFDSNGWIVLENAPG